MRDNGNVWIWSYTTCWFAHLLKVEDIFCFFDTSEDGSIEQVSLPTELFSSFSEDFARLVYGLSISRLVVPILFSLSQVEVKAAIDNADSGSCVPSMFQHFMQLDWNHNGKIPGYSRGR